jgi:hypothetical protein
MEFTAELRLAITEELPGVVAVEMPSFLQPKYLEAVERLPAMSVLLYQEPDDERGTYVPVEPSDPFTEAVRSAMEIGCEVVFIEPEASEHPHMPDRYPDPYAVRSIGIGRYVEAYRIHPQARTPQLISHAKAMAWRLQGANPFTNILVVVSLNLLDPLLDAMEEPQEPPPRRTAPLEVQLLNPHPACLAEITTEYPWFQERYERWRTDFSDANLTDRRRANFELLRAAEKNYQHNTGEKLEHWHRRLLARYSRNLAGSNGELVAGLFDLTVAARSIVDDNYAWEVWELANLYPSQKMTAEPETVNLSGEEVWLNTRKIRLRRRLPRPKRLALPRGLKKRKKEKYAGEWAEELDGAAICSYPPEDLVVEDYGRFLKQKARSMVTSERRRTQPFTTSLLDGIDLRETIRNWYRKKIYVQEFSRMEGDVGAVIVIFDEDRQNRYYYHTTWLGENQNESDMAYYSTHPFDQIVGPGIGRAEYGGFLMTLPSRRLFDVWSDPDYDLAESKAERLLLAAIDYSLERHIVYVAAKPPRSIFRSIASRMGRSILYIPIGQLSPTKLKKVRVVHVLDSHKRRETAKDYIW